MARLTLFSGLGADERLFEKLKDVFPSFHVPPLLDPRKGESLADYGKRLAQELIQIEYLGGASFGGMLALEIAKHLKPKAVFLMGSARTIDFLPQSIQNTGRLIGPLPEIVFDQAKAMAPLFTSRFGLSEPTQKQLLVQMLKDTPNSFLQWGAHAILFWKGVPELSIPVFHIHGEQDKIIPIKKLKPDYVLKGAGHAFTLTHPKELSDYLSEKLSL